MITLHIDTRNNQEVTAKLVIEKMEFVEASTSENKRPESILSLIEKVCQKANVAIQDIDEINVEEGPGSYTGLKVGASVANALSFALGKKVNGREYGELIEPKYE